jgi:hypothetical protein
MTTPMGGPYDHFFQGIFVSLITPGLILLVAGIAMGVRALRAAQSATLAAAGARPSTTSRRVFLSGWLLIAAAFSISVAYVSYYFPD